jgi:aminoglycoside phosphotransferase (APT) family kinase protein
MTAVFLNRTLREFRVSAEGQGKQASSGSGAEIHAVRTADGHLAYLKITPAEHGPQALEAARRELRFYRDLAAAAGVRTPALLAGNETDDGVALLLTTAGRVEEAASWSRAMWAALGEQLAILHSMPLPSGADWKRPDPLTAAMAGSDSDEITACWADSVPEVPAVLARLRQLRAHMSVLPLVFTHGDCHAGNVVFRGQQPALCDWQSAGVGRPASDLAFLSARAAPSGAAVPPDLVAAYLERRPQDRRDFALALLAQELAVFIFLWPPFLVFHTPVGIAHVHRRARVLATRWLRHATDENAPLTGLNASCA